jgi:hypothetical protein
MSDHTGAMKQRQHIWTLEGAQELIATIQPKIRALNYHVALGGGVLNRGYSDKDLDLYFLPFTECGPAAPTVAVREVLRACLGAEFNLGGGGEDGGVSAADVIRAYPPKPTWVYGRYTYRPNGRRIDVFFA